MKLSWKLVPLILILSIMTGVGLLHNVSYAQPVGPMETPCPTTFPTATLTPTAVSTSTPVPTNTPQPLARKVHQMDPCSTETPTPTTTVTPTGMSEALTNTPTSTVGECAVIDDRESCALGDADVTQEGDSIVISNIGSSGEDGVTIDLSNFSDGEQQNLSDPTTPDEGEQNWALDLLPSDIPEGTDGVITIDTFSEIDGVPNQIEESVTYTITDGELEISWDYPSIESQSVVLELYKDGELVKRIPFHESPEIHAAEVHIGGVCRWFGKVTGISGRYKRKVVEEEYYPDGTLKKKTTKETEIQIGPAGDGLLAASRALDVTPEQLAEVDTLIMVVESLSEIGSTSHVAVKAANIDELTIQKVVPSDDFNLYLNPAESTIAPNELYTVEVRVDDVENLYANDLEITFDPAIIEVVDADDAQPGTQLQHGEFFAQDVVLQNSVDNTAGTIQYSTSLQGDKAGIDGSGVLAYMTVRGLAPGTTPFSMTRMLLSDPDSQQIDATANGGQITVEQNVRYTLEGKVILERRGENNNSGAEVCVGAACVTTGDDGTYTLNDLPSEGSVIVKRPSYLQSSYDYNANGGETNRSSRGMVQQSITIPDVTLLGGDINQDGAINIKDAVRAGRARNNTAADSNWDALSDITDDGNVNVFDMVAVQANWNAIAPGPWGSRPTMTNLDVEPSPLSSDENAAKVAVSPTDITIDESTGTAQVAIIVDDVTNLYGLTAVISFDPSKIQVVDADSTKEGVQIQVGDLLDSANQTVLANVVDNQEGRIELSITQLAPAQAKSGSGTIGTVTFEATETGTGQAAIELASIQLMDNSTEPQPIPVQLQNGTLQLSASSSIQVYLPVIER